MTKTEAQEYGYAVEAYGNGFILCDYSGNRGRFGAAYRGAISLLELSLLAVRKKLGKLLNNKKGNFYVI